MKRPHCFALFTSFEIMYYSVELCPRAFQVDTISRFYSKIRSSEVRIALSAI